MFSALLCVVNFWKGLFSQYTSSHLLATPTAFLFDCLFFAQVTCIAWVALSCIDYVAVICGVGLVEHLTSWCCCWCSIRQACLSHCNLDSRIGRRQCCPVKMFVHLFVYWFIGSFLLVTGRPNLVARMEELRGAWTAHKYSISIMMMMMMMMMMIMM